MRVLVLNGSPKGKNSVTLQSVEYLKHHYKDDSFEVLHIGQKIRKYVKTEELDKIICNINEADLVLFSYPVYTFLAPYQLHRFIEALKERIGENGLSGKFATQITTSKHFYDVTAHNYIEDNACDLGMYVIKGLSADMDDLLTKKGRDELNKFWRFVKFSYKNNIHDLHSNIKEVDKSFIYTAPTNTTTKSNKYNTVIVTNCKSDDTNLINLIDGFRNYYPYKTRVVNLNDFKFSGGCLGCFNCATDGKCIYKDGFDNYLRDEIQCADAIVYAATIKDHSMGASFKLYDDRQFCNGHRMVTMGMPIGYILSGSYSSESNLDIVIKGRSEVGHNFLAGLVNDESQDQEIISNSLNNLSKTLRYALEQKLVLPQNFYGVGGTKIFRDLIYLMRGLMKADHKFYKKHGIYDFPQKKIGTRIKMDLIGSLMSIPSIKSKAKGKMNEAILAPYKKAITKG